MSKYKCGADVREGDTVERIEPSLSLVVGDNYEVSIPILSYGYISVVGGTAMVYDPLFFKLIKRKQKPKLVWKEMTLEEVKAVQVGDNIRINGEETEIVYTYNKEYDFGFDINPMVSCHHCPTLGTDRVLGMQYKFEQLVEETEMNTRLERTREYDVKLTGEEIAWLHFATARSCDTYGLYDKIRSEYRSLKLTTDLGGKPQSRTCGTWWDADYRKDVYEWLNKVFATPETEDQRKLRELKEQYESLGKAIDAMEKK